MMSARTNGRLVNLPNDPRRVEEDDSTNTTSVEVTERPQVSTDVMSQRKRELLQDLTILRKKLLSFETFILNPRHEGLINSLTNLINDLKSTN